MFEIGMWVECVESGIEIPLNTKCRITYIDCDPEPDECDHGKGCPGWGLSLAGWPLFGYRNLWCSISFRPITEESEEASLALEAVD